MMFDSYALFPADDWKIRGLLEEYLDKSLFTPASLEYPSPEAFTSVLPPSPSTSNASSSSSTTLFDHLPVATAFSDDSPSVYGPPDIILQSLPDSVLFFVHRHILLDSSSTMFAFLVAPESTPEPYGREPVVVPLPDSGEVINTFLCILYDLPIAQYTPSLNILHQSFHALTIYGCMSHSLFLPTAQVTLHLLHLAQNSATDAFEIYALAAAHAIEPLAQIISFATLPHSLSKHLNDDVATRIGTVYLRRLYALHERRKDELKFLMLMAPDPHPDTPHCDDAQRKSVMRAYALTAAFIAWQGISNPSLSPMWVRSYLAPLLGGIGCPLCREKVAHKIEEVVYLWGEARCTI